MALTGSCLCGDVAFEVDGSARAAVALSLLDVPQGARRGVRELVARRRRARSAGCAAPSGSAATSHRPERCRHVLLALRLDAADRARAHGTRCSFRWGSSTAIPKLGPLPHFFVGSKAPWYEIRDAAPQFDAFPPGMGEAIPSPRKTEPTSEAVRGSCLCGAVAYEIPRPVGGAIVLCHCTRCRRARAAAHNANLFVELERFRWLRGADKVESVQAPRRRALHAGVLPRLRLARAESVRFRAVIPAGSLDDDPGVRPALHIFVASKAPWFEIADDLPRYDEYAPGMVPSPPPR